MINYYKLNDIRLLLSVFLSTNLDQYTALKYLIVLSQAYKSQWTLEFINSCITQSESINSSQVEHDQNHFK